VKTTANISSLDYSDNSATGSPYAALHVAQPYMLLPPVPVPSLYKRGRR